MSPNLNHKGCGGDANRGPHLLLDEAAPDAAPFVPQRQPPAVRDSGNRDSARPAKAVANGFVGTLFGGTTPHIPALIAHLNMVAIAEAVNARFGARLFEAEITAGNAAVDVVS